jgi:hypothetical protein
LYLAPQRPYSRTHSCVAVAGKTPLDLQH